MLGRVSQRFLVRHPGQLLLALVGIAAGIAAVTGVALLQPVLSDALDEATAVLAGDDGLRIQAVAGDLDERRFAALAVEPGAPDLLAVLRAPVRVGGHTLELLAADWIPALARRQGSPALAAPVPAGALDALITGPAVAATDDTLARLNVQPGDQLTLQWGAGNGRVRVAAALPSRPGLDGRLLMDIASAQALLGRQGTLTEILAPAGSGDWLRTHLPEGWVLAGGTERRASARRLTAGIRANLGALSGLALATGLFVVFSVLSFLVVQRSRQFAVLRAVGVTRGRLAGMLSAEVALLAVVGGLAGLVAGTVLADGLLELLRQPVREVYGAVAPAAVRPGWGVYALALGAALAAALAVTVPVIAEAAAVPPGRQLRGDSRGPGARWAWTGLAVAAAGVAMLAWTDSLAGGLVGLAILLAGVVLAVPTLGFKLLGAVARGLPDGLAGRALQLLTPGRRRLAPAVSALTLAMALAVGMGMLILGFRGVVDDWVERLLRADAYLAPVSGALAADQFRALGEVPGVAAVSGVRRATLADSTRLVAYDLPEAAWAGFDWIAGEPRAGRAAFESGTGVLVTEPYARRHGLQVGATLELPTPGGERAWVVAGIIRDYSTERGFVAVDGRAYRQTWKDPWRDSAGLYLAGNDPPTPALRAAVAAALGAEPGAEPRWTLPQDIRAETLAVFDRTFRITWALAALVAIIAAVALTSALLALGLERGREYATLRALGLDPARLRRLVITQTSALAAVAAVLAVPLAILVDAMLRLVVQPRAFGWSVPLSVPAWEPVAIMAPLVLAVGLASGLIPAWKVSRRDPAGMLRAQR